MTRGFYVPVFITPLCILTASLVHAQIIKPLSLKNVGSEYFNMSKNKDSNKIAVNYSRLYKNNAINTADVVSGQTCNTSTFYMRIPAPAGEKIELKDLQTLPGGDFIGVGNVTVSGKRKPLLVRMANDGTLIKKQYLDINDKPASISNVRVTLDDEIIIGGVIEDGSNNVFVSKLEDDFSVAWIKTFQLPSTPLKLTLDLYNAEPYYLIFAVQFASSVACSSLTLDGADRWSKEYTIDGLTELAGFSDLLYGTLGLVTNLVENGKQLTQLSEIKGENGQLLGSGILGDGVEENKCFEVKCFNGRLNLLGVERTPSGGFKLVRNNTYSSSSVETHHEYILPATIDFNISAAMDNAADVMGFCLPQDGQLVFLRQFSYYLTTPEYTRKYNVPVGSSITATARSFIDGGYLFGLNTQNNGELILIKTDSVGVLAGCGHTDIANMFSEKLNFKNIPANAISNDIATIGNNPGMTFTSINLLPQFNCNQNYCPAEPMEDTCLSTYYKTFRSNSFVDDFSQYFLMRNDLQIAITARYDRVLGNSNQLTYGLKLFDEKGKYIKGVNVFLDSVSTGFSARQMDDKSILLQSYTATGNIPQYTFTLVSDNLEIIWSKSFEMQGDVQFGSDGPGSEDWIKDEEGNYYFTSVNQGFYVKPDLFVYKTDASGNLLWFKRYSFEQTYFGTAHMVSTNSSVIVIVEGFDGGSTSVRIDKNTGKILNNFLYKNEYGGVIYERVSKFEKDRIFYAGNTKEGLFLLGIFDTTGRPVKLRSFNNYYTIPRAGAVKNGNMYISLDHYKDGTFRDMILKVDTGLNVVYANSYFMDRYRLARGIGVSDNGGIYVGGNMSYGGSTGTYYDPYVIKFNSKGELGTCNYETEYPLFTEIDPQPVSMAYSELDVFTKEIQVPVYFEPDKYGQEVGGILCSSVPQCTAVHITGAPVVCKINTDYTYKSKTNFNCTLQPIWMYDTAFVTQRTVTDTSVVLNFKRTGQTWLKARLNTGCTYYEDSMLVQIQKSPAIFTLGNDTTLCPGKTATLNAGAGFNSYQWQDGSADSFFVVQTPGTYFVHASNFCGDTYGDTMQVYQVVIPALHIGNDTTICKGDTLALQATPLFKTYSWQPQSMIIGQGAHVNIAPVQSQMFIVNAITNEGCSAADSLQINIIQSRPVNIGNDTSFCDYDSVMLNADNGFISYAWNTGSSLSSVVVRNNGGYWVAAQDTNKCFAYDTLIVTSVFQHPVINLGTDVDLCSGSKLDLDPGAYENYMWNDGSVSRRHTIYTPGVYYVTVTDNNNCIGTDSIEIKSMLPLPADFLKPTDSICQYDQLQIQPLKNFVTYNWSTGSTQPFIVTGMPGIYTLTVKDINGCSGIDTIQVVQKNCMYGVFIPTAFTPNGDQRNDIFRAKVFGVADFFSLHVYNRFGQLVFNTSDPYKGWDGTFNGRIDAGTYVWQCSYQLHGDKASIQKGTVVLLR